MTYEIISFTNDKPTATVVLAAELAADKFKQWANRENGLITIISHSTSCVCEYFANSGEISFGANNFRYTISVIFVRVPRRSKGRVRVVWSTGSMGFN